jgi:hypothetical protein
VDAFARPPARCQVRLDWENAWPRPAGGKAGMALRKRAGWSRQLPRGRLSSPK